MKNVNSPYRRILSRAALLIVALAAVLTALLHPAFAEVNPSATLPGKAAVQPETIGNCNVFPANNIWNTRIDHLDPHPNSANFVSRIGANAGLHPDFGTVWNGAPNGIPYIVVPTNQPLVPVTLTPYGNEADPGPYPIPTNAPIEGGPNSTGDRHVLIVRQGDCKLFELYRAFPQANGSWKTYGAVFNLNSNALRTADWTSADAAGLAMLPGLVKHEEVQAALAGDGVIHHAFRFTVPQTYYGYVWPARHRTDTSNNPDDPPMGLRFRLKSTFNISGFSPSNQVILRTLKQYGMFVADNGSPFYLSGAPSPSWDDGDLHELQENVHGYDFEAVDEAALMVNPDSGQAVQPGGNTATPTRTATRTVTPAASTTPTRTATPLGTATRTPTRTATRTATRTPTRTATFTRTPTPCGNLNAPVLVAPAHDARLTGTTVNLSWNKRKCATYYTVQVRQDAKTKPNYVNESVTSTSHTLTLPNNHSYFWRVRACKPGQCGGWAVWRKFTLLP